MTLRDKLLEKLAEDVSYGYISGEHSNVVMPTVSFNRMKPAATSVAFKDGDKITGDPKGSAQAQAAKKVATKQRATATTENNGAQQTDKRKRIRPTPHSGKVPDVMGMLRKYNVTTGPPSGKEIDKAMGDKPKTTNNIGPLTSSKAPLLDSSIKKAPTNIPAGGTGAHTRPIVRK